MKRSRFAGYLLATLAGAVGAALVPAHAAGTRAGATTRTTNPASRAATGRGATTRAATASQPTRAALTNTFIDRYMAGDWGTLLADMTAKQKEIDKLPAADKEDLNYIKNAMADCRPAWWDQVKKNEATPLVAKLWVAPMKLDFMPMATPSMNSEQHAAEIKISVGWPVADMDNTEQVQANFTRGDAMSEIVWSVLARAEAFALLTPARVNKLTADQTVMFERFWRFRGTCAAAYYGMPRARRYMLSQGTGVFAPNFESNIGMYIKRPLGSMVLVEWATNQAKYPSVKIPLDFSTLPRTQQESYLAGFLCAQFMAQQLTFDEDKRMREAIKTFLLANGLTPADSGTVTLPNKLEMALDPAKDADLSAKRYTWLWEKLTGKKDTTQPGRGATTHP